MCKSGMSQSACRIAPHHDRAVIVNADFLSICRPGIGFMHLSGYGEVRGDKDLSKLPTFEFDGSFDQSVISAALNISGM